MYFRVLVLFGAAALCQCLTENAESSSYPVDFTTSTGIHMQFPYYEPILQEEISKELHDEMLNVEKDDRPGFGFWFIVAYQLNELSKKIPKEALVIAEKTGYDKYTVDMMDHLMVKSRKVAKTLRAEEAPREPKKIYVDVHNYIVGIIEAFDISPVGVLAAWGTGTINGVPVEQVLADIMGQLRYNGFSKLLGTVDNIFHIVLLQDQIKTKIARNEPIF